MACRKAMSRLCSRLQPVSLNKISKQNTSFFLSPDISLIKTKTTSLSPTRRFSRLPVVFSCLETMLPLHSAIASARLQSSLSLDSQTWCLVPQGVSMPL